MTTTEMSETDAVRLVDDYLSGWNETDPVERLELIQRCWHPDGALVDPPMRGDGHAGIDALARALHEHYPSCRFVRAGQVEVHNDAFRFAWRLVGPDGSAQLSGVDYGLIGEDGRLARITGFFDPPAPAEESTGPDSEGSPS